MRTAKRMVQVHGHDGPQDFPVFKASSIDTDQEAAQELVKVAKMLTSLTPEILDAWSKESRRLNYSVAEEVMNAMANVNGIDDAGMSDGFNDEMYFTISIGLERVSSEFRRRTSPGEGASEFVIPLRKIRGVIKNVLKRISLPVTIEGKPYSKVPEVTDFSTPKKTSWKDEWGNRTSVYDSSEVHFDIRISLK